ncbi:MAG TPA: hypothetical protein VNU26_13045 [Mycobacteriales bacterium]|nr:hypothetical protein [Mycobacteriales bacterium]
MQAPTLDQFRRGILAVSVLHDVDVEIGRHGVRLPGSPCVHVRWTECSRALAGHDPESDAGRLRLSAWLLARRWAADTSPEHLRLALRPVGLPVDHLLHPGLDWVRERVMGDALDLGFGAVGLDPTDPDRVVLLPATALDAARLDTTAAWSAAKADLERLGALAAERLRSDRKGQLRPLGDCDVVTLLGARSLRMSLAEAAGGMAAVVAPMRRRGWTQIALIDPAFGPAAAAATAATDRGFGRPLLVTPDELAVVPEGGRPSEIALRDPAVDRPWDRDVLYR